MNPIVNDPEKLFASMVERLQGKPAIKARVDAHILAAFKFPTLEAFHMSDKDPMEKVAAYKPLLIGIIKNDFSAFQGQVAQGQAASDAMVEVAAMKKSDPAPEKQRPPAVTLVHVCDKGTTSKEVPVEKVYNVDVPVRLPEDSAAKEKFMEKMTSPLVPTVSEYSTSSLIAQLAWFVEKNAPKQSTSACDEDRVRAIVREEIKAFFANIGK